MMNPNPDAPWNTISIREHIAMNMLAALIARRTDGNKIAPLAIQLAQDAVAFTNALIVVLNGTESK